jgi:hypothetical protein
VLWLFKHVSTPEDKKMGYPPIAIFGAYTTNVPTTDGYITEDPNTILFSLIPKFRCIYPQTKYKMPCSNYLNSDDEFKKGIGFSRDPNNNTYRIWIDENMSNLSSINNQWDVFGNEDL